jgi:hypothetical protein
MKTTLKLPMAGRRDWDDFGHRYDQGFYGRYWSSSPNSTI